MKEEQHEITRTSQELASYFEVLLTKRTGASASAQLRKCRLLAKPVGMVFCDRVFEFRLFASW
eukprot:5371590-Amphidinium_carterae.1